MRNTCLSYNLFYRLAAYGFLLSLLFQGCTGCGNSSGQENKNIHGSYLLIDSHPFEKRLITSVIARDGHQVTFYQLGANITASVEEKGGALRKLDLSIYTDEEGVDLAKIAQWSQDQQEKMIGVNFPTADQVGYVYIGDKLPMPQVLAMEESPPWDAAEYGRFQDLSKDDVEGVGDFIKTIPPPSDDPVSSAIRKQEIEKAEKIWRKILVEIIKAREFYWTQINDIKARLRSMSKTKRIIEATLDNAKQGIKDRLNYVSDNTYASPKLDVKCHNCKRRMGAAMNVLDYMDKNHILGIGDYYEADSEGGRIPNAPPYTSLQAFCKKHPNLAICFVYQCLFCYKEESIARMEKECASENQKYENGKSIYSALAHRFNRLNFKQENIKEQLKMLEN